MIQAQILFFERIGQSFEWKVYDYDTPADLAERLAAVGFEVDEPESIMVLELDEGHPLLLHSEFPDIRRLSSPTQVADVMAVERAVWHEELAGLAKFLTDCLTQNPAGVRIYAVYDDGRPVSAAWALFSSKSVFATLWGGSTLPTHRGRGYYSALLSVRAQEAWQRGGTLLDGGRQPHEPADPGETRLCQDRRSHPLQVAGRRSTSPGRGRLAFC